MMRFRGTMCVGGACESDFGEPRAWPAGVAFSLVCFAVSSLTPAAALAADCRRVNVAKPDDFAAAFHAAHDGDVLALAPGEYRLDKIQNQAFAQGVTITSADPSHKAVVDGIYLQDANGFTFRDLEVKVDPRQKVGVILQGGSHIVLENLDIHGADVGDGVGIRLNTAGNVTIVHSEIHATAGGIILAHGKTVSVLNNKIHDIQVDGIQSMGSSDVTISGNYFVDFYPKKGDHSDAIQFVGLGGMVKDITITDNTYVRGVGLADTQGIFMGNEGGSGPGTNYQNVTVTGNSILGGVYHGIMVSGADHLDLNHNAVQGYRDMGSWILIANSTNSSETDNIATNFNPGANNVGLKMERNRTIRDGKVGDLSVLTGRADTTKAGLKTSDAPAACRR